MPPAIEIKGSKLRVVVGDGAGEVGILAKVSWMVVVVGGRIVWVLEVDDGVVVMIVVDG